jgi:RimK family alpha-L-glutamate ligase
MKITLLTSNPGWHSNQLEKEALKKGITLNIFDSVDGLDMKKMEKEFGDVIIWRSIFLKNSREISLFKDLMHQKGRIILNGFQRPSSGSKLFQQKFVEMLRPDYTIPTFHFRNAEELKNKLARGILSLPLIMKPIFGMQGKDITLLKNSVDLEKIHDVDLEKYIFQPFIKNSGDYRVLVLGGVVLGAIKRKAKKGSYLNNISQGGTAEKVTDSEILSAISDIAIKIASAFNLAFCGIDVIYDDMARKYRLLEINTAPEWKGFQQKTGINVAKKILEYCQSLSLSKKSGSKTSSAVKAYCEDNYDFLQNYRFHYASRMWLWTKNPTQKKRLSELKNEYLNLKRGGPAKKINYLLAEKPTKEKMIGDFAKREPYFKKYPKLYPLQKILFFNLFAKTIYNKDLSEIIGKIVKDKEIIDLRNKILKDKRAIVTLSTFAINFFYLSSFYLSGKRKSDDLEPDYFLGLARQSYLDKPSDSLRILYILSHCIIGESLFYYEKISNKEITYLEMIRLMEKIIANNYFEYSLDIKFEFLVCAGLIGHETRLKKIILNEGTKSLSPLGNFIVDTINGDGGNPLKNHLLLAEHRNVLFLMANERFMGFKCIN